MKKLTLSLILALPILSFAHGDHKPPPQIAACDAKECTKAQVEAAVPAALEILVKSGRVDSSWLKAKVEKVETKIFKKGPEWMATLKNEDLKYLKDREKEKDKKDKLYVYITTKGVFNGANYTGE